MAALLACESPAFEVHQMLEILEGHSARIVPGFLEQPPHPVHFVTIGSNRPPVNKTRLQRVSTLDPHPGKLFAAATDKEDAGSARPEHEPVYFARAHHLPLEQR